MSSDHIHADKLSMLSSVASGIAEAVGNFLQPLSMVIWGQPRHEPGSTESTESTGSLCKPCLGVLAEAKKLEDSNRREAESVPCEAADLFHAEIKIQVPKHGSSQGGVHACAVDEFEYDFTSGNPFNWDLQPFTVDGSSTLGQLDSFGGVSDRKSAGSYDAVTGEKAESHISHKAATVCEMLGVEEPGDELENESPTTSLTGTSVASAASGMSGMNCTGSTSSTSVASSCRLEPSSSATAPATVPATTVGVAAKALVDEENSDSDGFALDEEMLMPVGRLDAASGLAKRVPMNSREILARDIAILSGSEVYIDGSIQEKRLLGVPPVLPYGVLAVAGKLAAANILTSEDWEKFIERKRKAGDELDENADVGEDFRRRKKHGEAGGPAKHQMVGKNRKAMKTETNEQHGAFVCSVCHASFKVKSYLTRHIKKHRVEKPYTCPFYASEPETDSELDSDTDEGHRAGESVKEDGRGDGSGTKKRRLGTKCHPTGGFSRRDTFKTHLRALHFIYPTGTKSGNRSHVSGRCAGCFKEFKNYNEWLCKHIETNQCPAMVRKYK